MRHYELLVILDPNLDERTVQPSLETFLNVIRTDGGSVEKVDVWGKRRLAYEIKRKTEGYYVVLQARAEPQAMDDLSRVLSLADEVIRHKVLRIPEKVYGPPNVAGTAAEHA